MPRLTSKTPAAPKKRTAKETLRTGSENEPTFQTPKEKAAPAPEAPKKNGVEEPSTMYLASIVARLDVIDRKLGTLSQEIAALHSLVSKPLPGVAPAPSTQMSLPGVAPSLDALKERVTLLLTAGQRQKVIDALTSLGVKKASELPEEDRQRFLDLLK